MAKSCAELVVKLLWKMPRLGRDEVVFWILRTEAPGRDRGERLGSGVMQRRVRGPLDVEGHSRPIEALSVRRGQRPENRG